MENNRNGGVGIVLMSVVGGILVLILLGVLGSALNLITIPWLKFDRQVQTNRDIITKTYNADNALYNYHWFQERAAAIKALKDTTVSSKEAVISFERSAGPRSQWTFEDKTEHARLNAVVQGQIAQYNSLVGEYNARAGEVDRAIFQDGLPTFFSIEPY